MQRVKSRHMLQVEDHGVGVEMLCHNAGQCDARDSGESMDARSGSTLSFWVPPVQ